MENSNSFLKSIDQRNIFAFFFSALFCIFFFIVFDLIYSKVINKKNFIGSDSKLTKLFNNGFYDLSENYSNKGSWGNNIGFDIYINEYGFRDYSPQAKYWYLLLGKIN